MPDWLTTRLRDRAERLGTTGLVFPSPGRWGQGHEPTRSRVRPGTKAILVEGVIRDRNNVGKTIRTVLDDAGMPWATANTFRTTVGDLVTKGLSGTEAANVLGHARTSMTYDRYSDRRQRADGAAMTLAGLM